MAEPPQDLPKPPTPPASQASQPPKNDAESPAEPPGEPVFDTLPLDVVKHIFYTVFSYNVLRQALTVCKQWNQLSKNAMNFQISPETKIIIRGADEGSFSLLQLNRFKTDTIKYVNISSAPNAFAVTSNNDVVAASFPAKLIKTWNVKTGALIREFKGHTSNVNPLVITRDNLVLFSGSDDKTIRAWLLESGEHLHKLECHTESVLSLGLTSDGKFLLSGGRDSRIALWRTSDYSLAGHFYVGAVVKHMNLVTINQAFVNEEDVHGRPPPPPALMRTAPLDPATCEEIDPKLCVVFPTEQSVRIWSVSRGICVKRIDTKHTEAVKHVIVSSNGKFIVTCAGDGMALVYSTSGELIRTLNCMAKATQRWVEHLAFTSPQERIVITSGYEQFVLWDLETGDALYHRSRARTFPLIVLNETTHPIPVQPVVEEPLKEKDIIL